MASSNTAYRTLDLNPKIEREKSRPLRNAELFLRDAHAMLFLPRKDIQAFRAGCNYAMLVTLCCVLGGVSRTIYPRKLPPGKDFDAACFKKLFARMPWGTPENGWLPREEAAKFLYENFRNPLIHELGTDEGGKPKRKPVLHEKYVVGKRGAVPQHLPFTEILARDEWDPTWPVIRLHGPKQNKVKVSLVGLYFLTRKLIEELSRDDSVIREAKLPIRS